MTWPGRARRASDHASDPASDPVGPGLALLIRLGRALLITTKDVASTLVLRLVRRRLVPRHPVPAIDNMLGWWCLVATATSTTSTTASHEPGLTHGEVAGHAQVGGRDLEPRRSREHALHLDDPRDDVLFGTRRRERWEAFGTNDVAEVEGSTLEARAGLLLKLPERVEGDVALVELDRLWKGHDDVGGRSRLFCVVTRTAGKLPRSILPFCEFS